MIKADKFYSKVRASLFAKSINQEQVDGINAILSEWQKRELTDLRWLSYILATAYHETARTMQPIAEYGRGKGRKYGVAHPETKQVYYGRGHVQLTWHYNYATFERLLKQPLTTQPDLALDLNISVQVMYEGMIKGLFTGKKLSDYFNAEKTDWLNARRIINGTDCMETIASYAKKFYEALKTT